MSNQNGFRGFYFSVPKAPEDMTLGELEGEIESAEGAFAYCEQFGHGISVKESVRMRGCQIERAMRLS